MLLLIRVINNYSLRSASKRLPRIAVVVANDIHSMPLTIMVIIITVNSRYGTLPLADTIAGSTARKPEMLPQATPAISKVICSRRSS